MTRHPLCSTPGCPAPHNPEYSEFHIPWCQGVHECFGGPTHQHWPKKGMGGRNPDSKIVSCLCAGMHDEVDNGVKYGNAVKDFGDGTQHYLLWQTIDGECLIDRVIGRWKDDVLTEAEAPALAKVWDNESDAVFDEPAALPAVREERQPSPYGAMSLALPESLTYERWVEIGATLGAMGKGLPWYLGDWGRRGEESFGEKASQALALLLVKYQRLANCCWVCGRIEPSRRKENLSWSVHEAVAPLEPDEQVRWLLRAEKEELNSPQLRRLIKGDAPECPKSPDGMHQWTRTCDHCQEER